MFKETVSLSFSMTVLNIFFAYFKNWFVAFFIFISGSRLFIREISLLPLI